MIFAVSMYSESRHSHREACFSQTDCQVVICSTSFFITSDLCYLYKLTIFLHSQGKLA